MCTLRKLESTHHAMLCTVVLQLQLLLLLSCRPTDIRVAVDGHVLPHNRNPFASHPGPADTAEAKPLPIAVIKSLSEWCEIQGRKPPMKRPHKYGETPTGPSPPSAASPERIENPCEVYEDEVVDWQVHSETEASIPLMAHPNGTSGPAEGFRPLSLPVATAILRIVDARIDCGLYGLITSTTTAGTRIFGFSLWYYSEKIVGSSPAQRRTAKAVHLTGTVLSLHTAFSEHFQHDVFDVLPRFAAVWSILASDESIRVLSPSADCTEILNELGFGNRTITTRASSDVIYTADAVILVHYVPPNGRSGNVYMGMVPAGSLRSLRTRLNQNIWNDSNPPSSIVYLKRPNGHTRGLDAENEVGMLDTIRKSLKPEYALKIFNHSNGWIQDRKIFAGAHVVFGPHGGAQLNILFSPPGSHMIEFNPMLRLQRESLVDNVRPCYLGLSQSCDIKYWLVEPLQFSFVGKTPILVNVQEVLTTLNSIGVLKL